MKPFETVSLVSAIAANKIPIYLTDRSEFFLTQMESNSTWGKCVLLGKRDVLRYGDHTNLMLPQIVDEQRCLRFAAAKTPSTV